MPSPSSRISPYRTWYCEAAYQDRSRGGACFHRAAMEGRRATNELEGLPAPLSDVLPDLSFARHEAQEIRPPASRSVQINFEYLPLNYQFYGAFD
jgi:hypothetical protein